MGDVTPSTPAEDLASALEAIGCRRACPVHTDAGRYAQALARRDAREAVRIARRNNPLVSVCAHICTHPCESACVRSRYDSPLALRRLKRQALQEVDPLEVAPRPRDVRGEGHRVAVVGAGPAGLSAAHDLALLGYPVTVFEAGPVPGGLPAQAIPEFRLPRAALERDIAGVVALGVEIRTGVEVPLDADLRDEGFERTLLAPGLPHGARLPVAGADHPRVVDGLDLLREIVAGQPGELGPRVVVIGGGDTAVDVARAAIRLPSVDEVELIFRRPRLDGRSRLEEAAAAQAEGVRLRPLSIPTSIEALDRGLGVVVAEVATYHDVHARYRPRARPGTRCRIDADHVLVAVGRRGPPLPEGGATQQTRDGSQLVVAPTWAAGGDRTGAGTVIRAVADGQALARRVDREITGCEPASSRIRGRVSGPPPHAWPRASQRMAAAAQEGSRCLNCFAAVRSHDEAVCVACGRCVDGCPAGALALGGDDEETVLAREDLCLRCGLCVERCPVGCLLWLEHTDDG
jgi:NADPH-dependent glutamate synthase beta subunit-like oxidoreductase/NAD-dependent dihydropyrimidine dehydrogenase PreA subunit